jgi:hypothetical protein
LPGDEKEMRQIVAQDGDFERIAAVLFPASLMPVDLLHQFRVLVRRRSRAPEPPQYADARPDYREQLHDAMTSPFRTRGS